MIAIIKIIIINNHDNQKIFIIIKSLFIKQIIKIKLLIIKSIMIMKINSNMIISINRKMFIKTNRLRKVSLIIIITKKINFIMKFMLISLMFILFIVIIIRFLNKNRNYINIYEKIVY